MKIECFLFVKIWLAYPFFVLCLISVCDDHFLTTKQMVL